MAMPMLLPPGVDLLHFRYLSQALGREMSFDSAGDMMVKGCYPAFLAEAICSSLAWM